MIVRQIAVRRHSLRRLALMGSALGSTLVVVPAAIAQNQVYTGATNVQNGGSVSGGPTTVSATTATGDISLTYDTVTAANPGSGTAAPGTNAAIYAANSGAGNTTVNDVNATITGSGASHGILATAQGGTVTVNQTGTVDATNAINGRGITALTNGGTIIVNANQVSGGLRGISTSSVGANGTLGGGDLASALTINVTNASATGAGNTPNAILAQGDTVVLNSGTASLTNAAASNGTAILVNAGRSATVTSGNASALGQNQAAIVAAVDGTLNLTSETVRTTQNSDGISIQGFTPGNTVTVNSGTITLEGANSGYGLVLGGNRGGNFSSGADGLAYSAATVTSGSITTAGANSYGIYATPNGTGTTTITSNNTTTTGAGSIGIYEVAIGNGAITGASTINSTGTLKTSGSNAPGVQVAVAGPITIANTGTISTVGTAAPGIAATATGTAIVSISNAGSIITSGGATDRMVSTNSFVSNGATASGIVVYAGGGAGVTSITNTGSITTAGQYASGISITPSGFGPSSRDVTINSNTITTAGDRAGAISVYNINGSINVNSIGKVSTSGSSAVGVSVVSNGSITINTDSVYTSGNNAIAVSAGALYYGLGVTVNAQVIRSTGLNAAGIQAGNFNNSGATSVAVADIQTTGNAIGAASSGDVLVDSKVARISGANSPTGITAFSTGNNVTITSSDLSIVNGRGIFAQGLKSATVNSTLLNETGAGGADYAITAQVASINPGYAFTTNGVTVNSTTLKSAIGGIRTSSLTGDTKLNSGLLVTTGVNTAGIYATATTGNISITSGSLIATGAMSNGINASATTGSIVINSTTAATSGAINAANDAGPANAILAQTGTATGSLGAITINSGTATATSLDGSAIFARGGGSVVVNSGTASGVGGTNGGGNNIVAAVSYNADATVNATATSAVGAGGIAVAAVAYKGNATATIGTATSTGGRALDLQAGLLATATVGMASASGNGAAAINAVGGTGVVLDIGSASSNGTAITTTNPGTGATTTSRADAVYATAINGAINATIGSASATGQGADAVRLIANGTGGAVTARITGTVSSTGGYGLFIDPPGANAVTVASGASVSGLTGISLTGGSNAVTNLGTITGTAGPGILAVQGATTLDNSGTIAGSGGTAVQLSGANDAVTLRTGSAVTGAIVGGGGTDTATLIGTGNAATGGQQVASFTGFDSLNVQSGYWTAASASPSVFATSATIASGATLDAASGANGLAVQAPAIVDNGALVVRGGTAAGVSTFGASVVTGSGSVTLTGGQLLLDGTNSLQNTGGTTVASGTNVVVTGTQGGAIVNNGTVQLGNGGTTGQLTGSIANAGTLVSNRSDSYAFGAALTGAGTFVKNGAGTVTFGSNYAFTGVTQLNAGGVKLTTPVAATTRIDAEGNGTFDLSGLTQTIAELKGASTGATINIAGGALTVNQDTSTSFAGTIAGNGSLTKTGAGSLNLTGANSYTGPTTVNGGRLAVNGSVASAVTVNTGGTLGGNGTIASVLINGGGTFAPGNSIGTTTVAGNVTFAAGSTYQVEANAAGMADRINAGSVTINGGTVQVLAAPGSYNPITQYTILTATGGVTGQFSGVTSSLAFLSPLLTYSTNAVTLGLFRNDVSFASMGGSPNGRAVAGAVSALGFGNPIYNAALIQTASGAPVAFGQLAGEIHATIPTLLIDGDRRVRDAVIDHYRGPLRDGVGLWAQSLGTTAHSRNQGGNANVNTTRFGIVGGADYQMGTLSIGVNGGWFEGRVRNPNVYSRAEVTSALIGGSVAWQPAGGRLSAVGGITHAWHTVDTTRTVTIPGLSGVYLGRAHATTTQAFGEAAFRLLEGPIAVTPFARYAHIWERADGLTETGGVAALTVGRDRRSDDYASAGVRVAGLRPIGDGLALEPNVSVGYLHGFGRLYSTRAETIGGAPFSITGDRLGRDNLDASGGVGLVIRDRLRLGLDGYLTRSSQWRDYGGKASVALRF